MPIAAVPKYLQRHFEMSFQNASPALRFGLLLRIWTTREDQENDVRAATQRKSKEGAALKSLLDERGMDAAIEELLRRKRLPALWQKNESGAHEAWKEVARLSPSDKARMRALAERQNGLARAVAPQRLLRLEAVATAPFTTGLGNEHPLENGFAFLSPYGLPYLPGSGVKGVIRQAARELASGAWGETHGWDDVKRNDSRDPDDPDRTPVLRSMFDVLFGRETEEGDTEHFRGVLTFWDVLPEIAGDSLLVEIMTPHQAHYYQQKAESGAGSITPHDSGQPNPICFLTVPPGSKFAFYVECNLVRLEQIATELRGNDRWKQLVTAAFEHAFRWLGFGAKTAVGYGSMKSHAAKRDSDRQSEGGPVAPPGPEAALRTVWKGATLRFNPGQRSVEALLENQRTAPLQGREADEFLKTLGSARAEQLKKKKSLTNVSVEVERAGNLTRLVRVVE